MIKNTEEVVYCILKNNKRARKDDFVLYGAVIKKQGVDLNQSLMQFLAYAKEKKMPSFETVSRCRRKLQEEDASLVDEEALQIRSEQEEAFKRWNYS